MKFTAQWREVTPGQQKFVHQWLPASAPRANVAIVHGLGEHGGRYHLLAEAFVAEGFSVAAFDQQGHGRSPEPRGQIRSYDSLLQDIAHFVDWNQTQHRPIPTVLFGHSMGGNLVLNFTLRDFPQPARVISSSPMIKKTEPLHPGFVSLARLLMRVAPNFKLRSQVVPERLMSDPVEQQVLRDDDLFHSQISLRLGAALIDSGAWALQHAQRVRTPLMLSHGTADSMTSHQASQEFSQRAGELCQLAIWDGHLHDPFRGLQRDEVIARFVSFIHQATSGSRA